MSLNSVNTNIGASIALHALNNTNNELAITQKRISTAFRVADAVDDGAAYAIAERVRSDVGSLTSANQQLGNVKGIISTSLTGLDRVPKELTEARKILVALTDSNTQGDQRVENQVKYKSLLDNVKTSGATHDRAVQRCWVGCVESALPHIPGRMRRRIARLRGSHMSGTSFANV